MKHAVGHLICWTGLDCLLRMAFARSAATIVVYHDPSPETMRCHLEWYTQRYTFVTLDAVVDALETGRWDALPPYPLVVTLDDGHRGNAALAPVFRDFGLRPTVFLCSGIVGTTRPFWWATAAAERLGVQALKRMPDVERRQRLAQAGADLDREWAEPQALTWAEICALLPVFDIGAHSRTHPILPSCDDARSADEIVRCRTELEASLARPCAHFSYPNGDFSRREVGNVRAAGYRSARTIDPGWNGRHADPFRLKAMVVSDDAPVDWLAVQVSGIPGRIRAFKGAAARALQVSGPADL